jgi:hypothetical protein
VDVPPEAGNASWPMMKMATVDIDRTFVHWGARAMPCHRSNSARHRVARRA